MGLEILEQLSHIPKYLRISDKFYSQEINIARIVGKDGKKKYISLTDNKSGIREIETPLSTRNEPIIPYFNIERWIALITGKSGLGKSKIESEFADQYHKLNPTHNIFYICGTPIDKDQNFVKQKFVEQIQMEDIKDLDSAGLMKFFENSLVLIDDCDISTFKKETTKVQNEIIEKGRKFHVSLCVSSHLHTSGDASKFLVRETDLYICFKDGLANNRFLRIYKNLKQNYLDGLKEHTQSWIAFNFKYNLFITPHVIKFLEN